ncbi:metal-dependent hydrolase family protein [Acuticoccus sediminis]|uniref:metal-dependent hydrolase family protein n=1 Tax=Acuticoccus sediminis TaxID=2184697 RepID=UPI001CFCA0DF|nr:amidohydrolase family protein [Acuticoccus sediminis]
MCACAHLQTAEDHAHHGAGCRCGAPETLAAFRRIEAHLSRRELLGGAAAVMGLFAGFGLTPHTAWGQTAGQPLLITNVRVFDGLTLRMRDDVDVLVEGSRIAALPPRGEGPGDAARFDGGGRALIPGLIDCHWHATLTSVSQMTAMSADIAYVQFIAAREAGETVMRGFTTVRDTGGPAFALKRAIDEGICEGPRIFPSGAMISQTAGHGDYRPVNHLPWAFRDPLSYAEQVGVSALADGRAAVLLRTREQLMKGASQIKLMAGGGVSSLYDPLDTMQFTLDELRAGVEAASDWGTYVCTHVYTAAGIRRSIEAGVKCIEHGQLADEATVKLMADEGIWWSIQPFLADEDANVKALPEQRAQQEYVAEGTVRAYEMMLHHRVKSAFGTDILMSPGLAKTQGRQLAKLTRFMSPLETLRHATGHAGELLALSGERAPYGGAPLGVIAPGALADLLIVDGEPERDLAFLADPDASLRLIMKGGRVVKDTMSAGGEAGAQ